MEKYVLEPGVVASLADDIMSVQEAHAANVDKRLRVLTRSPGILMDSADSYELKCIKVGTQLLLICRNASGVVWPDFQMSLPEEEITLKYQLGQSFKGYLLLIKRMHYEAPGEYAPNYHPEPGPQGDNTRSCVMQGLQLSTTESYGPHSIPLYELTIDLGGAVEILWDLRSKNSFTLIQDEAVTPPPAPRALEIHSRTALSAEPGSSTAIASNTISSLANASASHVMLDVSWQPAQPETEIWAYDVRCRPYKPSGEVSDTVIFRELILPRHDNAPYLVSFPAVHGVRYCADVRSISIRANRLPGEWCSTGDILAGADLVFKRPAAPSLEIQRVLDDPLIVNLRVEIEAGIPMPYKVQIFKRSSTLFEIGYQEQVLVYEGLAGDMQIMAESSESPQFRARVVSPGMLCSEYSEWQSVPWGVPPIASYNITRSTISLPIAVKINASSDTFNASGSVYCGTFYPPAPGARIVAIDFISHGSYERRKVNNINGIPWTPAGKVWLEVIPADSSSVPDTSKVHCSIDGKLELDIYGWQNIEHGFNNGPPTADYDKYHRHWYVTPASKSYAGNMLSEQSFDANRAIDINLGFDINETAHQPSGYRGCIIMIAGEVTITLEQIS